jgi:hypothetical protein
MTNTEFEAIVNGPKTIDGDIAWSIDEEHSPTVEFRVSVECAWPGLSVKGSFNAAAQKLSYVLICQGVGRIYALDLGADHHNPDCHDVGERHKHRWSEAQRDKNAYAPADITEAASNPQGVWQQFCDEANITHSGLLGTVPAAQLDFFL